MNTNFLNCTAIYFLFAGRRLRGCMWIAGRDGMPISRSILWQRSLPAVLLFLAVRQIRLHEGQKWSYSVLPNLNKRTSEYNRWWCFFESSNEPRARMGSPLSWMRVSGLVSGPGDRYPESGSESCQANFGMVVKLCHDRLFPHYF